MTPELKRAARILTRGLLAGDLREQEMKARAGRLVKGRRWVLSLVKRLLESFGEGKRPREEHVLRFIVADKGFQRGARKEDFLIHDEFLSGPEMMRPAVGPPQNWRVPAICTRSELALLLNLTGSELNWFANAWGQQRKSAEERLRHYRYVWLKKRDGNARLIEAPKERMKKIQRFIIERILNEIPPHSAVHGFRRGRSIKSFGLLHVAREVVLKVDLKDFFPSVRKARVEAVFRTAGYPEPVANLLAGICTNTTPNDVTEGAPVEKFGERFRLKSIYKMPHLPQARRARQRSLIYAPFGWIVASPGWRKWREEITRAMLMTWCSPATANSHEGSRVFISRFARSSWRRASRRTREKRGSCGALFPKEWLGWF
jgi:RNA-directed DNA polymerase